jgi:hypothetical protein
MSLLVGKRGRGGEKSDHHPDHEGAADSQAGRYQDNSPANQRRRKKSNADQTAYELAVTSANRHQPTDQYFKGTGSREFNIRTKITGYRSK